jgi:glycosyltransferase involved in cell wall biosynthesis
LPNNVIVHDTYLNWKSFNPKAILLSHFFLFLWIYFKECLALKRILPIKRSLAVLVSNFFKAMSVKNDLKNSENAVFYAFWFYDCIYLAFLKHLGFAEHVFVRAHGGDLFEERSSLAKNILFRNFQFSKINKVLSVSNVGKDYLQERYSAYSDKIETVYLGSTNHGLINPFKRDAAVIVSCAKIRNIKRIFLIAEALQFIDISLTWYHIGDENLQAKNDPTIPRYLQAKEALKKKSNIEMVNLGNLSNDKVLDFYKESPVSLFISLSETEGIPVSMMEAISFGIPILSTDVGACKEIVNEQTGCLIPLDMDLKVIAKKIEEILLSEMNTEAFRKQIRLFWEDKFDEKKNDESIRNILLKS